MTTTDHETETDAAQFVTALQVIRAIKADMRDEHLHLIAAKATDMLDDACISNDGKKAVISYWRKYGRETGYRTISLVRDNDDKWTIKRDRFSPESAPATKPVSTKPAPTRPAIEMPNRAPVLKYEVRDKLDNRVIATCALEFDARLIADGIGAVVDVLVVPVTVEPGLGIRS